MTSPVFLPWIRRGLASGTGPTDPLAGPLPAAATVVVDVVLSDDRGGTATASHTRPLLGPGSVTGVDVAQILRYEPTPGSTDVETNGFPFVELLVPDLPWLLTPASPTPQGALRPWLVLVVVEDCPSVSFDGGVLTVAADAVAKELWDLADSFAWAHVQSAVASSQVASEVDRGSGAVIARLLCPRKLQTSRSYRAALVPAFDAGVAAGLGEVVPTGAVSPAWDVDGGTEVRLPVYATWAFATSDRGGDFESLAMLLEPDSGGGRIGLHECRLDPGGLLPSPPARLDLTFEFAGALVDPGARPRPLPAASTNWLEPRLQAVVELGASRRSVPSTAPADYVPSRDDPVLAPNLYGQFASGRRTLPKEGWLRSVNLTVAERAAAGLGAEIVRRWQHEFLAAAWDQTDGLREAVVEANRARLASEVADRHHARLSTLDDGALLFAVGRAKETIRQGTRTVDAVLQADHVVPSGVVSAAFFRSTRSGSALARHAPTVTTTQALPSSSLAAAVAVTFLSAAAPTPPLDLDTVTAFTASFVPDGAILRSTRTTGISAAHAIPRQTIPRQTIPRRQTGTDPIDRAAAASSMLRTHRRRTTGTAFVPAPRRAVVTGPAGASVAASASAVRASLPSVSVAGRFAARATGVGGDETVPTRVMVGAWFPDGLSPKLQAISPELLVPGVGEFAMNRVRLLEINESFVAALLIGANHEWAREALWREFPADLGATSFASLFDRPGDPAAPGTATDLHDELHNMSLTRSLASMIGGSGSGTVLLMRAELVRRHPGVIVSLLRPGRGGEPPLTPDGRLDPAAAVHPMFVGRLDAATMFVGFDVDPAIVIDHGWWVNIEQPETGPRFGLDARGGRVSGLPTRWSDLTWAHVRGVDPEMSHLRFARLGWNGTVRDGLEWGRNAAHQAAITHQQPFRMLFPAAALIVSSGAAR